MWDLLVSHIGDNYVPLHRCAHDRGLQAAPGSGRAHGAEVRGDFGGELVAMCSYWSKFSNLNIFCPPCIYTDIISGLVFIYTLVTSGEGEPEPGGGGSLRQCPGAPCYFLGMDPHPCTVTHAPPKGTWPAMPSPGVLHL